jgi:hypothetical protein
MDLRSKKIVILQPMFFPWVGNFEQIRLAELYVHYDDVQLPQGRSFTNRVQIKTPSGTAWLTVPLRRNGKQLIKDVLVDDSQEWRQAHIKTLQHNYGRAPYCREMLDIVRQVYSAKLSHLADINIRGLELISDYFGLRPHFLRSSAFGAMSSSSERLLHIMLQLNGATYITGHGALNYLDYELFEQHSIRVDFMHYEKNPYSQLHGEFTPFVSILDLIANAGAAGRSVISSHAVYWKEFVKTDAFKRGPQSGETQNVWLPPIAT